MIHRWRYRDEQNADVDGPDEVFDDREQAENWLSSEYPELYDAGVRQVVLLDGDTEVYTMSLEPV